MVSKVPPGVTLKHHRARNKHGAPVGGVQPHPPKQNLKLQLWNGVQTDYSLKMLTTIAGSYLASF